MVRVCDRNEKGQPPPCHLPSYVMQICMPCCSLHARAGCRQVLLDFLPVLAALSAKPNGCTACCSSNQAVEFVMQADVQSLQMLSRLVAS